MQARDFLAEPLAGMPTADSSVITEHGHSCTPHSLAVTSLLMGVSRGEETCVSCDLTQKKNPGFPDTRGSNGHTLTRAQDLGSGHRPSGSAPMPPLVLALRQAAGVQGEHRSQSSRHWESDTPS